ncbi:hypothetical protein ASPCAL15117 [Aspergillus calidoustus]|uniref:HMA domain-containing protein n=1 Tax=Aspergillus calidoustus TaxID=454130 RepID=A0A0U5GLZ1_ASPCI|nr:hypothetical protein ASPCAL15117 [Aspergillus calidoustus]
MGKDCCHSESVHDEELPARHSSTNAAQNELCTEGTKCDDACIQAAALYECRQEPHPDIVGNSGGCKAPTCSEAGLHDDAAGEPCYGRTLPAIEGSIAQGVPTVQGRCGSSEDSGSLKIHDHRPPSLAERFGEACSFHLENAFRKYAAYIETGRCICRSVLSQAPPACGNECDPTTKIPKVPGPCLASAKSSAVAPPDSARKRACCTGAGRREAVRADDGPHCTNDLLASATPCSTAFLASDQIIGDVEKANARENVRLRILGMTCTGCAGKAAKTLRQIDGVTRAEVTFISSTGDIDINPQVVSAETIMQKIEQYTGFKASRVIQDNQCLDVILPAVTMKQFQDDLPLGICEVSKNQGSYRVSFDPNIIGARAVLAATGGGELAPPSGDGALAESKKHLWDMLWSTLIAAVLTIPVLVLAWGDVDISYSAKSVTSLVFATFVQALAVREFYIRALKSLIFSRVIEMDMLIVISISAAFIYSVVAFGLTHAGYDLEITEFFETSTLLITLVLFGRLMAAFAKAKAVSAVSMRSLQSRTALCVDPRTGEVSEIDARLLELGDKVLVRPHSNVVTDGIVVDGEGEVDESMLTGETLAVAKRTGDSVIAGTVNGPSPLTISITRLPGKNSISDIANLVENALAAKPRVQDLADKVASWFVPVVVSISAIVLIVWLVVALKIRGRDAGGSIGMAISYCIAVLAVSCPCALGLAVPMVLVIAGGVAAQAGVIIRQADAIERSYKVRDVIFDKTGTLTTGDMEVAEERFFPAKLSEKEVQSLVYGLVKDADHPVSRAVANYLQRSTTNPAGDIDSVKSIPGCGIQASWRASTVLAGNPYWLNIEREPKVAVLIQRGLTLLCVTLDSQPIAAFGLSSIIRPEANTVVDIMHRRGITCHIVSGDGALAVAQVAQSVNIPLENVMSRHSPSQKQEYVKRLMDEGKAVLFCGDGTNDAVAVAQANVGVQIGSTSDITRGTADVVLMGGLEGILILLDGSKRAFHRIFFNFVWSAIYNIFAILLASGAFVRVRIPPAYAGVGEIVSVLPVIFASLTLAIGNSARKA